MTLEQIRATSASDPAGRLPWALTLALLSACGGASSASTLPSAQDRCETARRAASRAWQRTAEAGEALAADAGEPTEPERVLDQLGAHRDALRAAPREVGGDEALELSNAMMDAIDSVSHAIPTELRHRADDAAEALLTDRGRDGSQRAARGAVGVMEELLAAAHPAAARRRRGRSAASELGQRAGRAAGGYAASAAEGDRLAEAAREAPVPEGDAPELRSARDEALEASDRVRRECNISRTISLPRL